MMSDEIFDQLVEHVQRPIPPMPTQLRFTVAHLRADIAATPQEDLDNLVGMAEDAHHAHLLERWTKECAPQLFGEIPEQTSCDTYENRLLHPLLDLPVEEATFEEDLDPHRQVTE